MKEEQEKEIAKMKEARDKEIEELKKSGELVKQEKEVEAYLAAKKNKRYKNSGRYLCSCKRKRDRRTCHCRKDRNCKIRR